MEPTKPATRQADRSRRRVNGEGTIFQRKDNGLWAGVAYVFTTNGVRKRRWVYARSADDVRTKLDKLRGDSANGKLVADGSLTLGEYLDHWLTQAETEKRATTYRGYESAVRLHIRPVLGKKRLDKLGSADVRQLIAVCRSKCLCCINGYDKHRPQEKQCCSVGKCCRRHPSTRQIQFIHAVLRNALAGAERDELIPATSPSW
jgi:hypothetical protein